MISITIDCGFIRDDSDFRKYEWEEEMQFHFISIALGLLFTAGGLLLALGKITIHFQSGALRFSREKVSPALRPIYRNVGEMISANGILFLLHGIWPPFTEHYFLGSLIAWSVIVIFDLWTLHKKI